MGMVAAAERERIDAPAEEKDRALDFGVVRDSEGYLKAIGECE